MSGRVLEVDAVNRRVLMTLKPGLVGSKLPPLTCLGQAVPGVKAHGVVTGTQVGGWGGAGGGRGHTVALVGV